MSDVANLENCKRLYELSGWKDTDFGWLAHSDWETGDWSHELTKLEKKRWVAGAYDLGYLLRKLPAVYEEHLGARWIFKLDQEAEGVWAAYYVSKRLEGNADTPEDAACLLAIKLFEQGILTKPREEEK